jgi:allantoate deiminase
MQRANALVGRWMKGAGLSVREDSVANLIGRMPASRRAAQTLLLGSHLDTVRDAGRFDGALGVLLPISALEVIRSRGLSLAFAVEVLGFSEEEGVRFSSAYLGSKGYTGRLKKSDLRLRDLYGTTVGEALAKRKGRAFSPGAVLRRNSLLGYLEVHIEQGPVLEARRLAAGVVSSIAGQTRAKLVFGGRAGHAGTTPMALRRDALAGAAAFVLEVEAFAGRRPPLVATVGRIAAHPGASNVIAGSAEVSLDVRHPVDGQRRAALRALTATGRRIAKRRGLSFSIEVIDDNDTVGCSKDLTSLLSQSVRAREGQTFTLASGAGHDGVIVSSIAPIAMLFVRCRKGLSHHPDEFVAAGDLRAALEIVVDFLLRLSSRFER